MTDNKYTGNRNVWRKNYGMGGPRRPPQNVTYDVYDITRDPEEFDPVTGKPFAIRYTVDLQGFVRHRDYFKTFGPEATVSVGEYDEGLVHFNNESSRDFLFNVTFSSTPYIVFSMEQEAAAVQNTENINIFGISLARSGANVGLSAPFSGTIRYRAIFSEEYPSYFYGKAGSIMPTTGWFYANAGKQNLGYQSETTSSWTDLGSTPSVFATTMDENGNFQSNISITFVSVSTTSSIFEFSSPANSAIHYLAVK